METRYICEKTQNLSKIKELKSFQKKQGKSQYYTLYKTKFKGIKFHIYVDQKYEELPVQLNTCWMSCGISRDL